MIFESVADAMRHKPGELFSILDVNGIVKRATQGLRDRVAERDAEIVKLRATIEALNTGVDTTKLNQT